MHAYFGWSILSTDFGTKKKNGQSVRILPVWVLLCIFRFSDRANTLPQPGNGHGKGFSPVCTLIWFTSLYLALNGFPSLEQSSQKQMWFVCSGPPTCSTVRWVTSSCIVLKVLLHDFLGFVSCSGSIHLQISSCLIGCLMYRKKAPAPWCAAIFMFMGP